MKKLLLFLLLALLLAVPCRADLETDGAALLDTDKLENAVPGAAGELLSGASVGGDTDSALGAVLRGFRDDLLSALRSGGKNAAAVLLIALLCAAVSALFEYGQTPEICTLAGCLGISAVAVSGVRSLIGLGTEALTALSDFSAVLLPTLCSAAVSSGAVTSAPAKYAATALFMNVLLTGAKNFIVPLIYGYLVTVIAGAALGGTALKSASKLLKWLCVIAMTVLTLAFTAYLSITGAVSGSADAAAVKFTKTAISATLPVVGGIVSDAASSVVAGAGILRAAVGAFGAVAVCAVCAGPVAALGAQYLLYKAAAAAAGALPAGRLAGLIDGVGDACGMMLGLTGCGAVMLFISIISSARAVTGL